MRILQYLKWESLLFIEKPHRQIMENKCNFENYFIGGILMTMFDVYLEGVSQHIYSEGNGTTTVSASREGHEGLKRMRL